MNLDSKCPNCGELLGSYYEKCPTCEYDFIKHKKRYIEFKNESLIVIIIGFILSVIFLIASLFTLANSRFIGTIFFIIAIIIVISLTYLAIHYLYTSYYNLGKYKLEPILKIKNLLKSIKSKRSFDYIPPPPLPPSSITLNFSNSDTIESRLEKKIQQWDLKIENGISNDISTEMNDEEEIDEYLEISFNPNIIDPSTNLADKMHSQLISLILSLNFSDIYSNKEVEYYFEHYGLKGYIDVIFWDEIKKPNIVIFEAKSKIDNLGETIRQMHKYREYSSMDNVDKNFGSIRNKEIELNLMVILNKHNKDVFKKTKKYLENSKIDNFYLVDTYKGKIYIIRKDQIDDLDLIMN